MAHPNGLDARTQSAVRAFLARLAGQYDFTGAVLFGSRARQAHRPDSDADVAVILHGAHQPFLDTKLAMADLAYDVLLETGVLIQPLPIWEGEWNQPSMFTNPDLLQRIQIEGVWL